jgi:hypothetical protein
MSELRLPFLDLADVQSRHNVVHTVCQASKHPNNPVLPLGDAHEWDGLQARPWEGRTVLYDEEERLFKCWYAGTDVSVERWWATGYAISEDGVHWEKPRLGLHEYRGSRDNNICLLGWGPVVKDLEEDDPKRRYKMIVKGPPRERKIRAGYSADGIHWSEQAQIDLPEWDGGTPDIVALIKDDQDPDPNRRFKMIWQGVAPNNKTGPERVRVKHLAFGPDVEHLTASADNPVLHPNDGREQENHFLMLSPYAGQYVMPYEYGWYVPNGTGRFGMYCADIRLAVSRDGEHFSRVQPHQPLIGRGPRGTWDSGSLVIADKLVQHNDRLYLYYCGNDETWTSWPGGNIPADSHWSNTGALRMSQMGLATLKLDRFTCLETVDRETPGYVVTRAFTAAERGARLSLNISDVQPLRSWVEVEALPPEGDEPLPGFSRADGRPLHRDGLREHVAWRDRQLADVGQDAVRLRIHFCGEARVHALNFHR